MFGLQSESLIHRHK
uniref:Uncharacterized protein n=1 Tax=Arundo donax TaxID=35708 RepID=A0A0A8Z608_ARUDO